MPKNNRHSRPNDDDKRKDSKDKLSNGFAGSAGYRKKYSGTWPGCKIDRGYGNDSKDFGETSRGRNAGKQGNNGGKKRFCISIL